MKPEEIGWVFTLIHSQVSLVEPWFIHSLNSTEKASFPEIAKKSFLLSVVSWGT